MILKHVLEGQLSRRARRRRRGRPYEFRRTRLGTYERRRTRLPGGFVAEYCNEVTNIWNPDFVEKAA